MSSVIEIKCPDCGGQGCEPHETDDGRLINGPGCDRCEARGFLTINLGEIKARAARPVTEIVANPREYYRVQQILRDRRDLIAVVDWLMRHAVSAEEGR